MTRLRAGLLLAVTVIGGAILQAMTALPGYTQADPTIGWVAGASALVLVVQLWAGSVAVVRLCGERPAVRRAGAWAAVVVVGGVVVAVLVPPAVVLYATVASAVGAAAASGRPLRLAATVFRHAPVRAVLATILALVLSVVSWVVAVVSGFFLTGVLGGIAMWVWFSVVGAVLLGVWTRVQRIVASRAPAPAPAGGVVAP